MRTAQAGQEGGREAEPRLARSGTDANGAAPRADNEDAPRLTPRFDDVFVDAPELQRTIDRSFTLAVTLRRLSDDFARAVQDTMGEIGRRAGTPGCPGSAARPYARAQRLGIEYLRVGRELARHHAVVQDLSQLGDGAGLTPDYRTRLQRVLSDYDGLLADYREMKSAFHSQLSDELRFAGCEPATLLAQAAAPAGAWEQSAGIEPEAPGRPAGAQATVAAADFIGPPAPARLLAMPTSAAPAKPAGGAGSEATPARTSGVLFYIDNSRCRRDHRVWLDGALVGQVKGGEREVFRATAGPHDLCLLSDGSAAVPPRAGAPVATLSSVARSPSLGVPVAHAGETRLPASPPGCGAPGTVRRSYLHEGWTIALRCDP